MFSAIWEWLDGNKTMLGGLLISLGLSLEILTQEDVTVVSGALPALIAGIGAGTQIVGVVHKAIKRTYQ